jgi:hypothetical protein
MHVPIVQSRIDARPKPRVNLPGCVLALLLVGGLVYAFGAGIGYLWWGRGFAGAMAGRHAPERIRAANPVYIYDGVIVVERDRVVFRRSWWAAMRPSLMMAFLAAIGTFMVRQRKKARWWMLAAAIVAGAVTFSVSRSRHPVVTVPRVAKGKVAVHYYGDIRGGTSTRSTREDESGYDIVLVDGDRTTRLVRLPWNVEEDAQIWRGLIEEKLRP